MFKELGVNMTKEMEMRDIAYMIEQGKYDFAELMILTFARAHGWPNGQF